MGHAAGSGQLGTDHRPSQEPWCVCNATAGWFLPSLCGFPVPAWFQVLGDSVASQVAILMPSGAFVSLGYLVKMQVLARGAWAGPGSLLSNQFPGAMRCGWSRLALGAGIPAFVGLRTRKCRVGVLCPCLPLVLTPQGKATRFLFGLSEEVDDVTWMLLGDSPRGTPAGSHSPV